ncbi:kinase suppressor of Ras 2 [Salvelinus sp. IW2-2015]|uniref:kinase suppressor of Ras 2 n=1 Tax=Salvelinus sp. IW2-2015 TaxID=2691554 RepID=UPI0038D43C6A
MDEKNMTKSDEQHLSLQKALQQCELVQNMIDISISSLEGLRTKCATSNDLTQKEIRTLEGKLVKYFSRQLSCKVRVALQEDTTELQDFPRLGHWFRIVNLRKEVTEEMGPGEVTLEGLLEMSDEEVCEAMEKFGANDEECARLNASLTCLRRAHKSEQLEDDTLPNNGAGSHAKQDWSIQWPTSESGKENSPFPSPEPSQWVRFQLSQSPKVQAKYKQQHHSQYHSPQALLPYPYGPYVQPDRLTVDNHLGLGAFPPMDMGHRSLPPSPRQRHFAHTPPRTPLVVNSMTPPGTPPMRRRNKVKAPGTPPPPSRKLIHLLPGFTALHRSKSHEFQLGNRIGLEAAETQTPKVKQKKSKPQHLKINSSMGSCENLPTQRSPLHSSDHRSLRSFFFPTFMPSTPPVYSDANVSVSPHLDDRMFRPIYGRGRSHSPCSFHIIEHPVTPKMLRAFPQKQFSLTASSYFKYKQQFIFPDVALAPEAPSRAPQVILHPVLSEPGVEMNPLNPLLQIEVEPTSDNDEVEDSEDEFEEMNLSLLSARNFPRKASQTSIFLQEWDIPFKQLEIGELIGKGRFGLVFHGRWHGEVAIRLIDIERDNEDQLKAFKREVMAYRNTRHENVVLFMGVCMSPPHLAIITSLCKGRTLYSVVRDAKVILDVNKTRQIAQEMVKGMGYLHAKGILHKDMKSKNVFYDNGKVVITDFGLFTISGVLQAGSRREDKLRIPSGWLCHLAPEIVSQLSPETEEDKLPFSKQSDVFAFGTIWYELHAREWPYKNQPAEVIIWQVGSGMKPNLTQIGMGKEISDILLFCWAFEQEERPSFSKLVDLLEKLPKRNRRLSHPGHFWKSAECS